MSADEVGVIPFEDLIALRDARAAAGLRIDLVLAATAPVTAPALVASVVRALVDRACAHAPPGASVRVTTRDLLRGSDPGGAPTAVEVLIEAPGAADPHAWTAIAAPILGGREGGAKLEVSRVADRWTTLRLTLDCPLPRPAIDGRGGPLVLLAEDDRIVREMISEALRGEGYRVVAATNGQAALDLYAGLGAPVDLLLTDVLMPRMSGLELARRVLALQPGVKVAFLSALPPPRGVTLPGLLIPKPLDLSAMLEQLPLTVAALLRPTAAG